MQIEFQQHNVFELRVAQSRARIAPQYGARLLDWKVDGTSVIYWPEHADWSSPSSIAHTRGGNPILFPFLGRHYVDGVLGRWCDDEGTVRELPMHGFARDMEFEVIDTSSDSLRMRLQANEITRAMFPYEFTFDVIYRLGVSTLEVTFECTNHSSRPLPHCAGHHFYFAIPRHEREHWKIGLPCQTWGHQNPDGSVSFEPAQKSETSLADRSLIDRFHLDFTERHVQLHHVSAARSITLDWDEEYSVHWFDVTTWTQSPDSDFYCVEPWLGLPNAIHHRQGLRTIAPGEKDVAACRISVQTS